MRTRPSSPRANTQGNAANPLAEPLRRHDESVEAACFDARVEKQYDVVADHALDMSRQLASYLRDGAPQTPSAIRMLVHELGDLRGKTVLDLGCGTGDLSVILARRGGRVVGVDVSPASVRIALRRARANGVSDSMTARVMSAHSLAFADASFDVVAGKAILHHLDLLRSRDEILRVLKPGGLGIFIEPIAFSKALTFMRTLIPVPADKETPDERQLSVADVEIFCQVFRTRMLRTMGLFSSRVERFFPSVSWWLRALFRFDFWALEHSHCLRKYADTMLIIVMKP
jgi:ubiquinone/menaquinone biosynthesis C-methylase UbiE